MRTRSLWFGVLLSLGLFLAALLTPALQIVPVTRLVTRPGGEGPAFETQGNVPGHDAILLVPRQVCFLATAKSREDLGNRLGNSLLGSSIGPQIIVFWLANVLFFLGLSSLLARSPRLALTFAVLALIDAVAF